MNKTRSRTAHVQAKNLAGQPEEANYVVKNSKGVVDFRELPRVKLSFQESNPVADEYFFDAMSIGSPAFDRSVMDWMHEAWRSLGQKEPWVPASLTAYQGSRHVPIKFSRNVEPCVLPESTLSVAAAVKLLTSKIPRADSLEDATLRSQETAALSLLVPKAGVPKTIRQVYLVHWICHHPGTWLKAQPTDVYYTAQWLDTHAHPGWYYPGAAQTSKKPYARVCLRIRVPAGSPCLRLYRHSHYSKRLEGQPRGSWMATEPQSLSPAEVRLPPGRYVVEAFPELVSFYNAPVLMVDVMFQPHVYDIPCRKPSLKRLLSWKKPRPVAY